MEKEIMLPLYRPKAIYLKLAPCQMPITKNTIKEAREVGIIFPSLPGNSLRVLFPSL